MDEPEVQQFNISVSTETQIFNTTIILSRTLRSMIYLLKKNLFL